MKSIEHINWIMKNMTIEFVRKMQHFVLRNDRTLLDLETGLKWIEGSPDMDWKETQEWIGSLDPKEKWRLPTIEELKTLSCNGKLLPFFGREQCIVLSYEIKNIGVAAYSFYTSLYTEVTFSSKALHSALAVRNDIGKDINDPRNNWPAEKD